MRVFIVLAMMAGWLSAAEAPQDTGADDEAAKLFGAMEEKLANAKSLQCEFKVEVDSDPLRERGEEHPQAVSYEGSLFLAVGNKARLEIEEQKADRPLRFKLVSDGARLSRQDCGMNHPQLGDAPQDLNAEILTWMSRPGVFVPQMPLPDVEAADGRDRFRVSDFRLGEMETVGERDAQRLEYQLAVKGQDIHLSISVWLDVETGLPVKRTVASAAGSGGTMTVTEVYKKLVLDEKTDATRFSLPE